MPLPSNFGLLALSPSVRDNAAFMFLQTGINGYIDIMIQSATGSPVNIMSVNSGVAIPSTVYVNELGNDTFGKRGSATQPFATIEAALAASTLSDTIEVFPGTYSVTGNIVKNGTNFYFHKYSALDLQGSGRIEIGEFDSLDIAGYLDLTNNGVAPYPIKILGNQNNFEFKSIYCGTGIVLISGTNSSVVFKGVDIENTDGSAFYAAKIEILNSPIVRFENAEFNVDYINSVTQTIDEGLTFKNCTFESITEIGEPCSCNLSGKFSVIDSKFKSFVRFFTYSPAFSEIKNTEFQGGIIVSGSNYFDNCVFNTSNFNRYQSSALIGNYGGNNVFANCYARNFNSTSHAAYTMRALDTGSGAANFNISNMFTSFAPNFAGTTVNYGTFVSNTSVK